MSLQHFKIIKELGQGSQGVVRLGQRIADGCYYALKEQNLKHAAQNDRLKAIEEAWLLGSLNHPGIAAQFDAFVQESRLIQVLEPGLDGDLEKMIRERGPLPEEQVWSFAVQLLSTLEYLARLGVYSRDVKPKNIVVSGTRFMLVDFGIFCMEGDPQTTRVGTPYFWAPELWYSTEHSFASEIYAAGCTLYQCCTGRKMFEGQTRNGLRDAVLKGFYQPISELFSQDLRQLIQAMTHRDPAKRPNAKELLESPLLARHIDIVPIPPSRGTVLYKYQRNAVKLADPISAALDGKRSMENSARVYLPKCSYDTRSKEHHEEDTILLNSVLICDSPKALKATSGNPSSHVCTDNRGRLPLRSTRYHSQRNAQKGYKAVRKAVVVGSLQSLLSSVKQDVQK